jgi:hypothetical protein
MTGAMLAARPQWPIAHFAFDAARIDPTPAGDDALFKNLIEGLLVQDLVLEFFLPRGE